MEPVERLLLSPGSISFWFLSPQSSGYTAAWTAVCHFPAPSAASHVTLLGQRFVSESGTCEFQEVFLKGGAMPLSFLVSGMQTRWLELEQPHWTRSCWSGC